MFPPKKKKPGMDVMIAVGKKPASDIGEPGSLDPPKRKAMPAGPAADSNDEPEGQDDHEAAESPGYESAEEQGAKLISDIEEAGQQFGLDGQAAREFAASVFDAMAECLRKPSSGGEEDGGEPGGAVPGGEYGR